MKGVMKNRMWEWYQTDKRSGRTILTIKLDTCVLQSGSEYSIYSQLLPLCFAFIFYRGNEVQKHG